MSLPALEKSEQEIRKQALEDLKALSKDEYEEVYRILKRNQVELSENSNGIFFDLAGLSADVFDQLTKFLEFCKKQQKNEEARNIEIQTLRQEQEPKAT